MTRPLPDALKAEILDNVPVIIAFHDQDQQVVWGNKAYQQAIGLSLPEIEGRRCHSVWGLAKPCRHCPVAQAIQTGEPGEAELTPEHPEGGPVTRGTWLSKAVPLKDEDGNLIGVVETVRDITEHKRVEQVRHESEQRYRTLFETMAQGVVYQTAEGHISAANPAAERILGLSLDQMRGKTSIDPAWQSIHEDGSPFPGADHPSMVALRTGETVAGVVMGVYHPHSGEHRWLMIAAVPEFLPGEHKPHSVYTTFTDITERRRAEERYQTLFQGMLDGFALHEILCDARGRPVDYRFLAVNPAFERLTGLKAPDIVGKTVLEVLPGTEPYWIETYGRVALTGEPASFENYTRDLDKYFQVTAFRPAPHQFVCTFADITAHKRADEEIRKFRTIADKATYGVAITDLDGNITYANETFARMHGWEPAELAGRHLAIFHSEDQLVRVEALLERLVREGGFAAEEVWHRKRDGSVFPTLMNASVIQDAAGTSRFLSATALDITELKRAEQEREKLQAQLAQAQKMESIGRLAGGVAHDFNNLLGVILGHTELALENANPAQPLYADLLEIQKAAQRSADLTRQLLAFARKQTIAPQVCDLNETVAGMLKMLRRLIGEPIALIWRPGSPLWPVKVDPAQIDQILVNLCVNARDAIAGVGQITIETGNASLDETYCAQHAGFVPGEYVRLAVSDDGCGMDSETLAHLFEPFFTTKGVGRGTGLGLATLYGVVKQNQGFVTVYSEPGQGTTFTLYWPRHRGQAAPAVLAGPAEPARRGHETVLLVEDEPALLHLGTMMLEKLGYRVLAAGTPGEAIRLAEEHAGAIHLLMTDVVMPEMNGRDLARRLLSLYPNLKRLFMSGYPASVIAPHGVLDDGVHFLQKPFAKRELAAKIREALEQEP
jgi:PAS domain S-box-containing protein